MSRAVRTLVILAVLVLVATAVPAAAAFRGNGPALRWPAPPAQTRIAYVGAFSSQKDWGKPVVPWWTRLWQAITGVNPQYRMLTPSAVATAGNKVYVADADAKVVWEADEAKLTFRPLLGELAGRGRFTKPMGLAADAQGRIFVADSEERSVTAFAPDGKVVGRIDRGLERPTGLALDEAGQRLYVSDTPAHVIRVYDARTLAPAGVFGRRGSAPGEFNYPVYLAFRKGRLYVTDAFNFRIQVLDAEGRPLRVFGKLGDGYGDLARPKGVSVDRDGHVYVVDALFENVQLFDEEGRLLMFFGERGQQPGDFWLPQAIWIDGEDRIFVADSGNHRVQVFRYLGADGR